MSAAIEVEKPTVDALYHVCIRWRNRISLQPIGPEWELSFPEQTVPLAGVWRPLVSHTLNDGLVLSFDHGNLELARSGPEVVTWCWVLWKRGNHERLVNEYSWEPNRVPEVNDKGHVLDGWKLPVWQRHIERVVKLWGDQPEALNHRDYMCEPELKEKKALALSQSPHNVRLFFPQAPNDGAKLCANFENLSRSSPYLSTVLSSCFAASTPRRSERARMTVFGSTPVPPQTEKDFEDSDDETDHFLFSDHQPSRGHSPYAEKPAFHRITIT
ncbi:hypothetical protein JCM11641_001356 [Rhodosporidiobolus odoratus]